MLGIVIPQEDNLILKIRLKAIFIDLTTKKQKKTKNRLLFFFVALWLFKIDQL
jgi:uncharacterized membrane protein YwzB